MSLAKLMIVKIITMQHIKTLQAYVGLAKEEGSVKDIKKGDTVLVDYDGKEIQSKVTWVGKYQKQGGYQLFEFDGGFKWTRVDKILEVIKRKKQ